MENFPPYFTFSDPTFGKEVFAPQTFRVTVVDRNPLDKLYVRWVSDYPEFEEAFSKLLAEDVAVVAGSDARIMYGPVPANCATFAPGPDATHRLAVIVSDREFTPPDMARDPELRFSSAKDITTTVITQSWNVTCQ